MKTCPKCNELIGDSVETYFNCRYNFILGRMVKQEERHGIAEEKKKQQIEFDMNRNKNALYENQVVVLQDKRTGEFDVEQYRNILNNYSAKGWRLKTVFLNEISKNASSVGYGGLSSGTNATIDQTILTFERCVRPSKLYVNTED